MQGRDNVALKVIIMILLYTALVLAIAWNTGPFFYHFAEMRLITVYSFFQLIATAAVALAASKVLGENSSLQLRMNPQSRPFFISALGFLFLGLDEIFSIHENLDKLIHAVFRMKETPWSDHIDDFILFLYGLIAIFFIKEFIEEFKKHPYMVGFIGIGVIMFFAMFCLDYISNNTETFQQFIVTQLSNSDIGHQRDIVRMLEDTLKLLGEACFLCAFVSALSNIRLRKS
jgi:hypothetical protein